MTHWYSVTWRSMFHTLAYALGLLFAIYATNCNQDNEPEAAQRTLEIISREPCRPAGIQLSNGKLERASDNSDVYYVGGLTLLPMPNSNAEMQLRNLIPDWMRNKGNYQIVIVKVEP